MKLSNELKPYVRDEKGWWSKKTNWRFVSCGIFIIGILGAYIGHVNAGGNKMDSLIHEGTTPIQSSNHAENCIKTPDGSCSFATKENLLKWKEWLEKENEELMKEIQKPNTFKASITKYSRKDSCHNPRGKECLTAIGKDTRAGVTIACPYNLKLGTRVTINGHLFVCEDRTARWVQEKHGPTFDIFTENHQEAINFGRQKLEVTILQS